MFNDMDEALGKQIKDEAMERFGEFPVLMVTEYRIHTERDGRTSLSEEILEGTYALDIGLLHDEDNDFEIRYVSGIIEAAFRGNTEHETSRKWTFGDLPGSYDKLLVKETEGRKVLTIEVIY